MPAYSPVRARDVASAAFGMQRSADSARRDLEALLKQRYFAEHVVLVDSGTHALQLAIELALRGQPAQAPVALPAYSCFDMATAAIGANARVMLYDLDPATLAPDIDSLTEVLRTGARVVVVAPLYGIPIDSDRVSELVARFDATLIEDAAQGQGATWRGRPLGAHAAISIISFGRGKGWTGGQGGALLLRDSVSTQGLHEFLSDARHPAVAGDSLRNTLILTAQWLFGRPSVYGVPRGFPALGLGETRYHAPTSCKELPDSAARAIMSSASEADAEAVVRRSRAAELLARLPDTITRIRVPEGGVAGYLRVPIVLRGGMRAFASADRMLSLGVASGYPITLAELDPLKPFVVHRQTCEGAASLVARLVTLPAHSRVGPDDVDGILRAVSEAA